MTYNELFRKGARELRGGATDSPLLDAEVLLAHAAHLSRTQLVARGRKPVPARVAEKFLALVRARKRGQPVAYLAGEKEFFGNAFRVSPAVLVPRPESEWLVERTVELLRKRQGEKKKFKVLDIGTGSGCIVISVAKKLQDIGIKNIKCSGSDISSAALRVARANARRHNIAVKFFKSDLLESADKTYDVIIANLPYVPKKRYRALIRKLKNEPRIALTDGTDNWQIYRKFFRQLPGRCAPGGSVLIETDSASRVVLNKYAKELLHNWLIAWRRDLSGRNRFIELSPAK